MTCCRVSNAQCMPILNGPIHLGDCPCHAMAHNSLVWLQPSSSCIAASHADDGPSFLVDAFLEHGGTHLIIYSLEAGLAL